MPVTNTDSRPARTFKPRIPARPHHLPKGWRWLKLGEKARSGDFCCDPRIEPVEIEITNPLYVIGKHSHPVRRKVRPNKAKRLKTKLIIWADYDPRAKRGNKWAFYTTKSEQRSNRPDLKPIKLIALVAPTNGKDER